MGYIKLNQLNFTQSTPHLPRIMDFKKRKMATKVEFYQNPENFKILPVAMAVTLRMFDLVSFIKH